MQPHETLKQNCVVQRWRALGVEAGKGSEWLYVFESNGRIQKYRGAILIQSPALLELDSLDRWLLMFPHPMRSKTKIDTLRAAEFLMKECWRAQVRRDESVASKLELAQTGDAGT